MRKQVLIFGLFPSLLFCDISSRDFLLPEKQWELSFSLVDAKDRDDLKELTLPFRYGLTDHIELIPFGIKLSLNKTKTDHVALLAHISDIGYSTLEGWQYGTTFGLAWRNTEIKPFRIDLATQYSQIQSEISRTDYYAIPLKITYHYSKTLEIGLGTTLSQSNKTTDYKSVSLNGVVDTDHISTIRNGIYLYYYFTDDLNIKSGVYQVAQDKEEPGDNTPSYSLSESYNAFLYRIDWRF